MIYLNIFMVSRFIMLSILKLTTFLKDCFLIFLFKVCIQLQKLLFYPESEVIAVFLNMFLLNS